MTLLTDVTTAESFNVKLLTLKTLVRNYQSQKQICLISNLLHIIKCSEKCARRDWSERVQYISIEHTPYVTQVHCWDIRHAAYVIGTSARNSWYILVEVITWFRVQFGINKHELIFSKTNKIARALQSRPICGLWKINKYLCIPHCIRKIMWLRINNINIKNTRS